MKTSKIKDLILLKGVKHTKLSTRNMFSTKKGWTLLPFFTTFFGIIREKCVSIKFRTFFAF